MTTIRTQMVGDSGPYAYRVHGIDHPKAGEYPKYFEYLGPVGKVDPEKLTEDEIAELREEGFALARFRDGTTAEFGSRRSANHTRDKLIERWGEDVLAPTDDRRETEVQLAEDAVRGAVRIATADAQTSRQERESGPGHAELDRNEKKRVRWEDADNGILHAKRVKAGLSDKGIKDWESHYDPDLTADEIISETDKTENSGGERMDADEPEIPVKLSNQLDKAERWAAKGVVEEDSDEAAGALEDDFGWQPDEVQAIRENSEAAAEAL